MQHQSNIASGQVNSSCSATTNVADSLNHEDEDHFQAWQCFRNQPTDSSLSRSTLPTTQSASSHLAMLPEFDASMVNYSSLTLSPATPQANHYQTVQSLFPYHLDRCYDFDLLCGSDNAMLDSTDHSSLEYFGDRGQRKSITTIPENLNTFHADAALSCCDSPPCTDPSCSDVVFCNEEAACCYLEQCLRGDPCDSEECAIDIAISPPCYSTYCEEPTCAEAHTTAFCSQDAHSDDTNAEPICTCVDPACLSKDHGCHYTPICDDGFARPAKRLKTSSASEGLENPDHGFSIGKESCAAGLPFQHNKSAIVDVDSAPLISIRSTSSPSANSQVQPSVIGRTNSLRRRQNPAAKGETQALVCRWKEHDSCCEACFTSDEALQQHVESAHISRPSKQNEYYCYWVGCSKYRVSDGADIVKLEQFEDEITCEENSRRCFGTRPKLKRHAQVHTGYKPYQCEICGTQMKTRDALVKHQRTHTGEKPYLCRHCDKRFATTTELKTHSTVHTGEKPHICPECGERFADSSNLSKHKKTHFSGMFKCEECDAQMKRWDQMKRHIEQRGHMRNLLDDPLANKAYKARMSVDFKPERVETRTEQKKRRESDRGRSHSVLSED